ncbi:MAG: hypothetical protein HFI34_12450 [Lachnospiraceae bacterium]|nr:hypothetical protein [Lachnospiraceae bacterium]
MVKGLGDIINDGERGLCFVIHTDDCVIAVRRETSTKRVMYSIMDLKETCFDVILNRHIPNGMWWCVREDLISATRLGIKFPNYFINKSQIYML